MFDDKFFDDWLESQAQKVMEQVAIGQSIASDQMMILMLKAQTNHFAYLDYEAVVKMYCFAFVMRMTFGL